MAITTSLTSKDEFINTTEGWLGVVTIDHLGAARGTPVAPGASAFLSEEEQILTANAPMADEDNPFADGSLKLKTRAVHIRQRRPYGGDGVDLPADGVEREVDIAETGAAPQPAGDPPEGSRPPQEEVATPDAPAKMSARPPRRRRSA